MRVLIVGAGPIGTEYIRICRDQALGCVVVTRTAETAAAVADAFDDLRDVTKAVDECPTGENDREVSSIVLMEVFQCGFYTGILRSRGDHSCNRSRHYIEEDVVELNICILQTSRMKRN